MSKNNCPRQIDAGESSTCFMILVDISASDVIEQLLILFENNKGCYFSGEEIAETLSVSRTAVWKAVKTLRDDGYRIDAVPNRGYRLAEDSDILSAQGICRYLAPDCAMIRPEIFPVLDSTNRKVREQAAAGEPAGTISTPRPAQASI